MKRVFCKSSGLFKTGAACLAMAAFVLTFGTAQAEAKDFKLGIVTFLSGGAAGPFGIPANNAADLVIDAINSGSLPAPYNTAGLAGMNITKEIIDEAGGSTKQVSEYRNLVQRKDVDAIIGYISSGDCLAIAPVAEEMKKLTIMFDCGTPRVFEEGSYKYVFRTGPTSTMDNVAAARYIVDNNKDVAAVSGINQNYSWGQDSWHDFINSMKALKPNIKVGTEQFPKIYAGQYGAEISTLMVKKSNYIHSSFWGGDMEGLVLQGSARGLFDRKPAVLTCGETAMYRLADQIPEGTILGGRGPFGIYAPDNALNRWFRENFIKKFGTPPTYPAYKMAQALLGLKAATEKAAAAGNVDQANIIKSFENLEFKAPSGTVRMALGNGHQAVQEMVYGQFTKVNGKPAVKNVKRYAAECVNPPEGMTGTDWIKKGFTGAKCD